MEEYEEVAALGVYRRLGYYASKLSSDKESTRGRAQDEVSVLTEWDRDTFLAIRTNSEYTFELPLEFLT